MKKRKILTKAYRILLVFFLTGCVIALGSSAVFAAAPQMPTFTPLGSIAAKDVAAAGVATDAQGRVYVADSKGDRVIIYTQSGRYIKTMSTVPTPISVAVAPNGTVFVGSYEDKSVTAYANTGSFKLGIGSGEFVLPRDIQVDSSGNIYVADPKSNSVRVYGADGVMLRSIGTSGVAGSAQPDGAIWYPLSIAVNENASELVVLDRQQVKDTYWSQRNPLMVNGARIQVFSLDGTFLRSYSIFGYASESGEVSAPSHVAVDAVGRIYVSDTGINKVMVYGEDTVATPAALELLGMIKNNAVPATLPKDLFISQANVLYVVHRFTHERVFGIQLFGLDGFSAAVVAPSPITYQAIIGGNNPVPKSVTIENLGNSDLVWTATGDVPWISLTGAGSTLARSATSNPLDIPVDITGLDPGTHTGTVVIDAGVVTENVTVTLNIEANPLVVTPATIPLNSTVGTTPTTQTIKVTKVGDAPLNWTATADKPWIKISPAAGTAPSDVTLAVDVSQLSAGNYSSTITFVRAGDDPGPVTVTVTLTLTDDSSVPPDNVPGLPAPGSAAISIGGKHWRVTQVVGANGVGINLKGVWGTNRKHLVAVGDKGAILSYNGKKWSEMKSPVTETLYSVWGSSENNVYAVGDAGRILHFDGKSWSSVTASTELLQDVFGVSKTDVVAAGAFGAIVDADTPSATSYATGVALRSVWGSANDNIYVVGEAGTVLHYDGISTTVKEDSGTSAWLNSVWGRSDSDIFAVGEKGSIIHNDGKGWSAMDSGTTEALLGVWGNARNDVFAVGANSIVLHYDGTKWRTIMAGGTTLALNDVWASARSFVVAVGDDGIILTAKRARFPWNTVIRNIANISRLKEKEKKTKK